MPSSTSPAERWIGALCPNVDPEIFFPKPGRPAKDPVYKEICSSCPVQNFCLEYGIVHEEQGVWGGLSKSERDLLDPSVRNRLVQKAHLEGWYEDRPSVEDLLSDLVAPESTPQLVPDISPVGLLLDVEETSSVFSFETEPPQPAVTPSVFEFDIAG
jgi:WhiB family transcriptional regulator, redox-sensing transcriptional regulator